MEEGQARPRPLRVAAIGARIALALAVFVWVRYHDFVGYAYVGKRPEGRAGLTCEGVAWAVGIPCP